MIYREFFISKQTELSIANKALRAAETEHEETKKNLEIATKALEIVNAVLLETQMKVKSFIEDTVTMALQTVFDSTYEFVIEYEIKRNKSEAYIYIVKDGDKFDLKNEVGGGVVDVASFGLRIALWALATPSPEPVLILDEPGKYVSSDKQEIFAQMIKEISNVFDVQIIVISHSDDIIQVADKSIFVTQTRGVSNVEEI